MTIELDQNSLRPRGSGITKLLSCCVVLALIAGCGGEGGSGMDQGGSGVSKNSAVSKESVFNRRPGVGSKNLGIAYQDGFTAGRNSKTDFSMNWMKNWDKDADWRMEYDRGWKEGRNLRKLQDQRNNNAGG